MRCAPLAAALFLAGAARASSVRDEITVGGAQSTPQNPRAGNFSNLFAASVDVGDDWTASGTAQVTLEEPTPAPAGSGFADSGGTVTDFSLGVDWDATDNWTFGLTLDVSPESAIATDAQFPVRTAQGFEQADALLRARSSNVWGEVSVTYDTAGTSDLEWTFTGALALSRFETQQRVEQARVGGTTLTPAELRTLCSASNSGCRAYVPAIDGFSDELRSARITAGALATIKNDTDVGLNVDYYRYFDDPASVGVYSIAAVGRFGAGAPIAPLRYLIRPDVTHRAGALSFRVWVQAGEYAANVGQSTAGLGMKVQYKLTRALRMWIAAIGQRDVGIDGDVSRSGWLSLGAAYRF
jgi:hypothetical protein